MLFFKRTLPLIITFVCGFIMIASFFSGEGFSTFSQIDSIFTRWVQIVITFTMILGAVSLLQINVQKISRKQEGYGYSIALVAGFLGMSFLGFLTGGWPMFEAKVRVGDSYNLFSNDNMSHRPVTVVFVPAEDSKDTAVIVMAADGEEIRTIASKLRTEGMTWFVCLRSILFEGIFKAAQATMFSLLAFYVASASFRAFRIKSREAALLMGSAFIVMLGNVPVGDFLSKYLEMIPFIGPWLNIPAIKEWILTYPSSAGQSAIVIGATLGMISASIKVILGVERSHLGGKA